MEFAEELEEVEKDISQFAIEINVLYGGEEAFTIRYTKSDVEEMIRRRITDDQWGAIVDEAEDTLFNGNIYDAIKLIAERVTQQDQSNDTI